MGEVQKNKIAIIGLGYVGRPLFFKLHEKFDVVGYDKSDKVVDNLKSESAKIPVSSNEQIIAGSNVFIVCVPTPVDHHQKVDLTHVKQAAELVGKYIKNGGLFILESTVFPGTTRNICGKIIEDKSGIICGRDFDLGYSSERLSPGSNQDDISNIVKVVSGNTDTSAARVAKIYKKIIKAGVYVSETLEIAEASKLLENIQRDVNIALFNEFGSVCTDLGINFEHVVRASATKWNFHKYQRGLVGGHCISVDPFYFMKFAETGGLMLSLIPSARKVNDLMQIRVSGNISKAISDKSLQSVRILFLGLTYKENLGDIRNSGAIKVINYLKDDFPQIDVVDPHVDKSSSEFLALNIKLKELEEIKIKNYNVIILAVGHDEIIDWLNDLMQSDQALRNDQDICCLSFVSDKKMKGFELCL